MACYNLPLSPIIFSSSVMVRLALSHGKDVIGSQSAYVQGIVNVAVYTICGQEKNVCSECTQRRLRFLPSHIMLLSDQGQIW
jgi:nicotinamidase-related amidase